MAAKKSAKRAPTKKNARGNGKAAAAKARSGGQALEMSSASPSLTVNDLDKSLKWYRDVLGFEIEETWPDDSGKVMGVSLRAGKVSFMIGQDDWKKGRERKKGEGFRMFCMTTKNVDALADRIKAKGGRLDHEPTDQPWGVRDFSVTDPDGFKITIANDR
jgi:uncharacterized glyoxalase superfamily protein PhnB